MKQITIRNPDTQGIYHCWHYCRGCGKAWTYPMEDWEDIMDDWEDINEHIMSKHHGDWSLLTTAPTDY